MGRKKRSGLDYYPKDTDVFSDRKIRRLNNKYCGVGYMVYDFVCCETYRDDGYYLNFDQDYFFDVADVLKLEEDQVKAIIEYCVEIDLFDKGQFEKGILTSRGIQQRWVDVSRTAKRSNIEINPELLVSKNSIETPKVSEATPEDSEETPKTSEEKPISSEDSTQSKKKESKPKKVDINLSFIEDDDFKTLVQQWLVYKKERNQSYKGLSSVKTFHKKLLEYSRGSYRTAKQIIENSIGNNYSGIFPPNNGPKKSGELGQILQAKDEKQKKKLIEDAGFN